jgi:hypothetical protein
LETGAEIMSRPLIVLTACLAVPAAAQTVPTTRLSKPDVTFTEPFSQIIGLREIAGGRVIISDGTEDHVALLDFAAGDMKSIGRQGGGPGEYGSPGPLLALTADTTIMPDFGNRRALLIGPGGEVSSLPLRDFGSSVLVPRWSDGRGRLYGQAPLMLTGAPGGGAPQIPDSMPVLRWDRATDRLDTVLMVPNPMAGGGGAVTMMVRGAGGARPLGGSRQRAFYPADVWAVVPDGRIALVRADDYHVEWIGANGRKTVGPTIPYERIKVTKADQDEWIKTRASGTRMVVNGRRMTPPPIDPKDVDWAEYKPPFASSVAVTPEGELWVPRSQPAGAKGPLYDVFDSRGGLVRQVRLPEGRRLVGFGRGTLYAVHKDADDLEWLERYRRTADDDR